MVSESQLTDTLSKVVSTIKVMQQYLDEVNMAPKDRFTYKDLKSHESYGELYITKVQQYQELSQKVSIIISCKIRLKQLMYKLPELSLPQSYLSKVKLSIERLLETLEDLKQAYVAVKLSQEASLRFFQSMGYTLSTGKFAAVIE